MNRDREAVKEEFARLRSMTCTPIHVAQAAGPWLELPGEHVVFSAPHAATHLRGGVAKTAEPGTSDLALALATRYGAAAICAIDPQTGDPSWDADSPYFGRLCEMANVGLVIDLHAMRPRAVDIGIGLGPHTGLARTASLAIVDACRLAGVEVAVNWPFRAERVALTSQLQRRGVAAIQVELSLDCFDPTSPAMAKSWVALSWGAATLVHQAARSRNDG